MSTVHSASADKSPGQRPRDAATLIIVRRDGAETRVLMGKRHGGHVFMPNKHVFPGGRLDAADCRVQSPYNLHDQVEQKLLLRMRGRPSASRARGLALAALRETFEETGFIAGKKAALLSAAPSQEWQDFADTGYAPDPSALKFIFRAITPPGRSRRFDARFFLVDAAHIANLDSPYHGGSGELLETAWLSLTEALSLDLPSVTRHAIGLVGDLMEQNSAQSQQSVPFHYSRRGKWQEDIL